MEETTIIAATTAKAVEPPIFTIFTATTSGLWESALGWLIREATHSDVNHAALCYWSLDWGCWMVVGADANGIVEQPLASFTQTRIIRHMYSAVGFSLWDGMRAHVADVDKHYAYSGLFGMAFVEIAGRLKQHPRYNWFEAKGELFCSQWIAEIIDSGLREPLQPKWTLYGLDSSVIDPGRLCSAEQRSLLFAESHPAVLELPWRSLYR